MWIARDKCGNLWIHKVKPIKIEISETWDSYKEGVALVEEVDRVLFPEVKWEDDEPTELILKR